MTKTYKLKDLDCANCAAKIEHSIKKMPGVDDATVSFMTQKLTITAAQEPSSEMLSEISKLITKIEPDCSLMI